MLDKSVKHYRVIMIREDLRDIEEYPLQKGYRFSLFQAGDEKSWADIEASVGEFESLERAYDHFMKEFEDKMDELKERCFFVEIETGEKVATAMAWYGYLDGKLLPRIHWVAVKEEHQGRGLCKALISRVLSRFVELGYTGTAYLTTQTWSYKAIHIYQKFGFIPYDDGKKKVFTGSNEEDQRDFHMAWDIIHEKISLYENAKKRKGLTTIRRGT
ncbi:MAG: GNAT family N-acetyltransferase [Clostridia bacterium]|jgi:GNAT superfamily N-acetyltransferase